MKYVNCSLETTNEQMLAAAKLSACIAADVQCPDGWVTSCGFSLTPPVSSGVCDRASSPGLNPALYFLLLHSHPLPLFPPPPLPQSSPFFLKKTRETARKILSSMKAFISNRGNYQRRSRHRVMVQEGKKGGVKLVLVEGARGGVGGLGGCRWASSVCGFIYGGPGLPLFVSPRHVLP